MHCALRVAVAGVVVLAVACSPPRDGTSGGGSGHRNDAKVRIGVVGAFSGPLSYVGTSVLAGVEYAVDERNDTGGVLGKRVEVLRCDGKFEPSTERTCLTRLVHEDAVDAVVLDSPVLAALDPKFLASLDVPVMQPVVSLQELDSTQYPNTFGMEGLESSVAVLARHLATVTKARRVAVLAAEDDIAEAGLTGLKSALRTNGLELVGTERFDSGQADLTAEVRALQKSGADVLVVLGLGADAARALKAAGRLGWNPQVAGTETLYMRAYRELGQEATNGTLLTLPHAGDADTVDPAYLRWMFEYFRRYGVKLLQVGKSFAPDYPGLELPAYELTSVVLDAMEAVNSTAPSRLVRAIERDRRGFHPVGRTITWSVDEHLGRAEPKAEVWVARFQDGHVLFDPDPRSVPALEAARVAVEEWLFGAGKVPKPSVRLLRDLAARWRDELVGRREAIVARAGQERYDVLVRQADAAVEAAAQLDSLPDTRDRPDEAGGQ